MKLRPFERSHIRATWFYGIVTAGIFVVAFLTLILSLLPAATVPEQAGRQLSAADLARHAGLEDWVIRSTLNWSLVVLSIIVLTSLARAVHRRQGFLLDHLAAVAATGGCLLMFYTLARLISEVFAR